jgi:hypothetical protein
MRAHNGPGTAREGRRITVCGRRFGDGLLGDRPRPKALVEHPEGLYRHAPSDPARIEQPLVRLVVAKEQRANEGARALRVRPADDNELGAVEAFGLAHAAVARQVGALEAFRDDPFRAVLTCHPSEDLAVITFVIAIGDPRKPASPTAYLSQR